MTWQQQYGDSLTWLIEPDCPAVRALALRDLLGRPPDDPDLLNAQQEAHTQNPIATILNAMHPDGYWVKPGAGYGPKYQGTVWSLIMLAQVGASAMLDERISRACAYLLDHALTPQGQFSGSGTPGGTADCLQGNLYWTLRTLGYQDSRLETALDWMARSVTGEGVAPLGDPDTPVRYYAGKRGPGFLCGSNNKLPCAWGAAKVMLAFSTLSQAQRSPLVERAITQGVAFLLSVDPAVSDYPSGYAEKPSGNWWKPQFPVFYITDALQVLDALTALGHGADPRLANAIQRLREKADPQGRWHLEADYAGKTWVDWGPKKAPNKWVTLRALRVLKRIED
ncbi:MAG: nitrogen fixation protein NifH [Anaerolineae bacterium]